MGLMRLYPNPNLGNFQIDLGEYYNFIDFEIYDSRGLILHSKKIEQTRCINQETNLAAGVYYVHLKTENESRILKLIVKL
jgi:hypothetical protein